MSPFMQAVSELAGRSTVDDCHGVSVNKKEIRAEYHIRKTEKGFQHVLEPLEMIGSGGRLRVMSNATTHLNSINISGG